MELKVLNTSCTGKQCGEQKTAPPVPVTKIENLSYLEIALDFDVVASTVCVQYPLGLPKVSTCVPQPLQLISLTASFSFFEPQLTAEDVEETVELLLDLQEPYDELCQHFLST